MKAFDLEIGEDVLRAIAEHGERCYPREACGIVLGPKDGTALTRVVAIDNVAGDGGAAASAEVAFRLDDAQHLAALREGEAAGLVERALYHSHADTGAYLSPIDRAGIVREGADLFPGVLHIVMAVRSGRSTDAAAYRYEAGSRRFDEVRLVEGRTIPDLALRALEGSRTLSPIRPVGGLLMMRRLAPGEREVLVPLAEGRRVPIDAEAAEHVRRLGLGLYSPLTGFMRSADIFSVEHRGRIQSGAQWREPISLEVAARSIERELPPGALVELVAPEGTPLCLMPIVERRPQKKDKIVLGGPVYVYSTGEPDAGDVRTELLSRGARRVLAVTLEALPRARGADLGDFDALIAPEPIGAFSLRMPAAPGAGWLAAAMAQNLGATHVWVEDASTARAIGDSLEIELFQRRS